MGHRDDVRPGSGAPALRSGRVAYDRHWALEARTSVRSSVSLLVLLLLIDAGTGCLTWWRGLLWGALAVLLLLVLCPPRVSAGEGWLESRSPLVARRVRTDLLRSARAADGVSRRVVLRDVLGARVEIDLRVLTDNPELWHRLREDIGRSAAGGSLRDDGTGERRLARRMDRETALAVFRVSGLEP
ncbi:hypothetical protein ACF061_32110 [Streptomyces sp. NPDC015220]|uniref:hypothetical protein n=1 Tax=Streptomyces sp. NPDC015220 TaxID=3364947 RepID=UPI0036F98ED3